MKTKLQAQICVAVFMRDGSCFPVDLTLNQRIAVVDLIQKMHGGLPKLINKELPLKWNEPKPYVNPPQD